MRRLLIVCVVLYAARARADDLDMPDPTEIENEPERSMTYELDLGYFSIRLGGGVLIDYNRFEQSDESQRQLSLHPESGIRDLRGLISGKLPWDRLSYTAGLAFSQATNQWGWRQSGLKLSISELRGFWFFGRTKEGFSTSKFTTGYYGWFMERSTANDAFVQLLADGARWTGAAFGGKFIYNFGAFDDVVSETETFNKFEWQAVARAVWVPLANDLSGRVLHLAGEVQYAGADDGFLQFSSKPEAFLAQEPVIDTGKFRAQTSTLLGVEAYYLDGPLSIGLEYFFNFVQSRQENDPFFHGGELFAAYLFTGETHPYNDQFGFFEDVVPKKSFFRGGPGAIELALRITYTDLDSEAIEGGKFWRFTSQLNWYLTQTLRLEGNYGYGVLDRFGIDGGIHFLQARLQLAIQ